MKDQRISVPIDFTPVSEAVLEIATTLARGSGGRLVIVHVHQPLTLVTI